MQTLFERMRDADLKELGPVQQFDENHWMAAVPGTDLVLFFALHNEELRLTFFTGGES